MSKTPEALPDVDSAEAEQRAEAVVGCAGGEVLTEVQNEHAKDAEGPI